MAVQFAGKFRNCFSCSQLEDCQFAVLFFYFHCLSSDCAFGNTFFAWARDDTWLMNEWKVIGRRIRRIRRSLRPGASLSTANPPLDCPEEPLL